MSVPFSPRTRSLEMDDKPAHTVLRAAVHLGISWANVAKTGRIGSRLQRLVEWSEGNARIRHIAAASHTQTLLSLGERVLCTLDSKLAVLQSTRIGRPVFVLMGSAAKRAEIFLQPHSPVLSGGDSDGEATQDSDGEATQVFIGPCDRLHSTTAPQRSTAPVLHREGAPDVPDSLFAISTPARLRAAIAHQSPRETMPNHAKLGMEKTHETSLFTALAVPFFDAQQLLFDAIPKLAPSVGQDECTKVGSDDMQLLFAGLPTGRRVGTAHRAQCQDESFASFMLQGSNSTRDLNSEASTSRPRTASNLNLFSQHLDADDKARGSLSPARTRTFDQTPCSSFHSPPAASDTDLYPSSCVSKHGAPEALLTEQENFRIDAVDTNPEAHSGRHTALAQEVATLNDHARHPDPNGEHTTATFCESSVSDARTRPPSRSPRTHTHTTSRLPAELDSSIVTWLSRMGGLKVNSPHTHTKSHRESPAPRHPVHPPMQDPASTAAPIRRLHPTGSNSQKFCIGQAHCF